MERWLDESDLAAFNDLIAITLAHYPDDGGNEELRLRVATAVLHDELIRLAAAGNGFAKRVLDAVVANGIADVLEREEAYGRPVIGTADAIERLRRFALEQGPAA